MRRAQSSEAIYSSAGLFQTCFKANGVRFSSDPTGPVGMMYARTGMPTMKTLNHHSLVQIGLMRTIWTTVSQTPAQMNGIPFHTRRRTFIFRSPHFPRRLPFFINLFCKPAPPPLLLLLSIAAAASSETLILF